MTAPLASICLPTFDGEADLRRLLPALARQRLEGGFELVAIDSSSSDRSRELLAEAGAEVEVIAKHEFRHGGTRNRIAAKARGRFLVFLSQDVEPVDERFLASLVAAFDHPKVAGAYARVLPRPDDDPLTQRTALEAPEAADVPSERELVDASAVDGLEGPRRAAWARFNNVASAIRADVFRELPFPDLDFGEDTAWAERALRAGWRIRFVPQSAVYHAHRYTPATAYERYRVDAVFQRRVHGYRVRPSLLSALRGFAYEVSRDLRFLTSRRSKSALRYALVSPLLRGAQVLGQWVGSRARNDGYDGSGPQAAGRSG
jgi:rhamnosyltransferase